MTDHDSTETEIRQDLLPFFENYRRALLAQVAAVERMIEALRNARRSGDGSPAEGGEGDAVHPA